MGSESHVNNAGVSQPANALASSPVSFSETDTAKLDEKTSSYGSGILEQTSKRVGTICSESANSSSMSLSWIAKLIE